MKAAIFRKFPKVFALMIIIMSICSMDSLAYTFKTDRNYMYDKDGNDVYSPDAYTYANSIELVDNNGKRAVNPLDMFITEAEIFIVDTDNNRIMVFDKQFKFKRNITQVKDKEGKIYTFNKPEGIFVGKKNILLADTQNNRILEFNKDDILSGVMTKPEMVGVPDDSEFLPIKVSMDSIGKVYAIIRNVNFGFVQLDSKGQFLGYIGAPKAQTDLSELFWRKFSTQGQLDKMLQFTSTEYNNIFIDKEDFIWGTIGSLVVSDLKSTIRTKDLSGNVTPIRKLNSTGTDILKRTGKFAPVGDVYFSKTPSRIVDVAVGENGIYSLLDQNRGHVFTYDDKGNLLYVFGNKSNNKKTSIQQPVAINYIDKNILVLDMQQGKIHVFEPTDYGKLVLKAIDKEYNGNFEEANSLWSQIADENMNFEYSFIGLGKAKLKEKKYTEALNYFKYADDPKDYSNTFAEMRKKGFEKYFPVIFTIFIFLIIGLILYSLVRRFIRYYKGR